MPDPPPQCPDDGIVEAQSTFEGVPDIGSDGQPGWASIGPSRRSGEGRTSDLMTRLTLSALERASTDPNLWREPVVHRAVLVSGLSVLVGSLVRLKAELERSDAAG
jgi:hypothetical protein